MIKKKNGGFHVEVGHRIFFVYYSASTNKMFAEDENGNKWVIANKKIDNESEIEKAVRISFKIKDSKTNEMVKAMKTEDTFPSNLSKSKDVNSKAKADLEMDRMFSNRNQYNVERKGVAGFVYKRKTDNKIVGYYNDMTGELFYDSSVMIYDSIYNINGKKYEVVKSENDLSGYERREGVVGTVKINGKAYDMYTNIIHNGIGKLIAKDSNAYVNVDSIIKVGRTISASNEKAVIALLNKELLNKDGYGYKIKQEKNGYFDKYTLVKTVLGKSTGTTQGSFYLVPSKNGFVISKNGGTGYKGQDSKTKDASIDVVKVIKSAKTKKGKVFYIVQDSKGYYWVTIGKNGDKGGTLAFSLNEAEATLRSFVELEDLRDKYGREEGYRRFMSGARDAKKNVVWENENKRIVKGGDPLGFKFLLQVKTSFGDWANSGSAKTLEEGKRMLMKDSKTKDRTSAAISKINKMSMKKKKEVAKLLGWTDGDIRVAEMHRNFPGELYAEFDDRDLMSACNKISGESKTKDANPSDDYIYFMSVPGVGEVAIGPKKMVEKHVEYWSDDPYVTGKIEFRKANELEIKDYRKSFPYNGREGLKNIKKAKIKDSDTMKDFKYKVKFGADMKTFVIKAHNEKEALVKIKALALKYKGDSVKSKFDGNSLNTRDSKNKI